MFVMNSPTSQRRDAHPASQAARNKAGGFRLSAESVRDGITIVENGAAVYANRRACEIFGYPLDEYLRLNFFDLAAPEEKERVRQAQACFRAKKVTPEELVFWIVRKDGTRRCVQNRYSVPQSHSYVVTTCDITERRQAEEALRDSEARYRLIAENMSDLVCLHMPDARHVYVSPSVLELLGYTPDEMLAASPYELSHPEDAECVLRPAHQALLKRADMRRFELRVRAKDGRYVWLSTTAKSVFGDDGRVTYLQSASRNITDRKVMSELLISERAELANRVEARTAELRAANTELVRALRAKDEFFATMSHELRTPLTGILGQTDVLRMGLYGALTERQVQSLNSIEECGQHLLGLITDILDLAKTEVGKLTLQLVPASAVEICQASLRFIDKAAQEKGLRVSYLHDTAVADIQADPRRLKQILINLLVNAVKFTPAGGQVGLEVQGSAEEQAIRFTVWDTGIGIPSDKVNLLFQPFVQLDSGFSREYDGTGLGLALVRRLAELHGGRVGVESEGIPGRGSRFTVWLPWQPTAGSQSAAPANDPSAGTENHHPAVAAGQPLVLLADDNATSLTVLSDYLTACGFQVAQAHDGAEAVERARTLRPALVVMDIQMPGLNGLEAIRALKTGAQNAPRIIALTALAMPGDKEQCLAAGADLYLSKPVRLIELAQSIKGYLDEASGLSAHSP